MQQASIAHAGRSPTTLAYRNLPHPSGVHNACEHADQRAPRYIKYRLRLRCHASARHRYGGVDSNTEYAEYRLPRRPLCVMSPTNPAQPCTIARYIKQADLHAACKRWFSEDQRYCGRRGELRRLMREIMSTRAERFLFVYADENSRYSDVIRLVDDLQNCIPGIRLVLLTRKSLNECFPGIRT
jgi:hypothetical protein